MKRDSGQNRRFGFSLVVVLIILGAVVLGGSLVWQRENPELINLKTFEKIVPTQVKEALPSPTPKPAWENSTCGNGICEPCEDKSECCNYPCRIDPKSGNEFCPPPTCLGNCPEDCHDAQTGSCSSGKVWVCEGGECGCQTSSAD